MTLSGQNEINGNGTFNLAASLENHFQLTTPQISGTAFGQAMNLAKEIVKFPQECLKADRQSALYNAYSAKNLETALSYETEHSARVLTTEAIVGAKKFAAGLGKHGKFNVNQISEKEAWQKELEEMKNSSKIEDTK